VSDLPHSRQQVLRRAVISPQNGHILCEPKSRSSLVAWSFKRSMTDTSFLPSRLRNRRRLSSICPWFFPRRRDCADSSVLSMTRILVRFCGGLLTMAKLSQSGLWQLDSHGPSNWRKCEQLRPAIPSGEVHHNNRDEHFLSSLSGPLN
jgi:hypothetical protein